MDLETMRAHRDWFAAEVASFDAVITFSQGRYPDVPLPDCIEERDHFRWALQLADAAIAAADVPTPRPVPEPPLPRGPGWKGGA